MEILEKLFPETTHIYIGFTSLLTSTIAEDYDRFSHFSGKSRTRHTQDIIDIWFKDPTLPELILQAYGGNLELPKWINIHNVNLFLAFLEEEELRIKFVKHGIHLCISQMEGFGHYINEARSISALVITLDAPPMNELVDSTSGVLIPVKKSFPHHCGVRFIATPEAIKEGIQRVLEMPIKDRKLLGENARKRFIKEQDDFVYRLKSIAL